jgi:hypothetical protein
MDRHLTAAPLSNAVDHPRTGDVIVNHESHLRIHYSIRQVPGPVQMGVRQFEQAIRLAESFAECHHVFAWYCDHGTYRLLDPLQLHAG